MNELLVVVLFLLGFILIFKGGDLLVESSIWISSVTKISPMIIGATVVSLATTLPETMISILAVKQGDYVLSTSNAMGSMIVNFALILGISFIFYPSKVDKKSFANKCGFLFASILLLCIFPTGGKLSVAEGIVLLVLFVVYILANVFQVKGHKTKNMIFETNQNKYEMIIQFLVGAISIAYGASVLVQNITPLGQILKIDHKILALTLVAFGTSLPELVTTIKSIKHGNAGIGFGNMIGANIINATMILGSCAVLSQGNLSFANTLLPSLFTLVAVNFVVLFPTLIYQKTFRWQGAMLIAIYIVYVFVLYNIS